MFGQGPDGPGQGLRPEGRAVHRAPFGRPEKIAHAAGDEVRGLGLLGGGEASEPAESIEGPDEAHGREEVGQGRNPVGIVGPELDRRFGIGGPVIAVGQEDLLGPGGVFRLPLLLIEIGIDDGHLQKAARGAVAEDVERIERLAPLLQELGGVGMGPVGRGPGIGQVTVARRPVERGRKQRDEQETEGNRGQAADRSGGHRSHGIPPWGSRFFYHTSGGESKLCYNPGARQSVEDAPFGRPRSPL